ncbi:hypothetical protein ENUP19_0050G0031 [Entamoeba nuttalli]|uniref:RNA polymerase II transcription factor B subunit 5 n=1 Tax=Entamoeba nuttalli TaxID=412467 RepID=A0ABQ0DBM4_9EUKA
MSIEQPTHRCYEESSGMLFEVKEAHLLALARKIAKNKDIQYEEVDDRHLFLKNTEANICAEVQAELDKYIYDKAKKQYYR